MTRRLSSDATSSGSTGSAHLNQPVVGMMAAPGGGYWLVASDGGVFTFGSAAYLGSMGGNAISGSAIGIVASAAGYSVITSDGQSHAFGGSSGPDTRP
jgi:hypothetical protein